ncbi:hypothetical protein SEA_SCOOBYDOOBYDOO_34 [Mycobacterium phage ScoobyDoobyDoo]|nr:hypothetical protein SEA_SCOOBYDOOBYDOO_34 [Mycobacterium phage ScoobyDoobyDoo]
MSERKSLGQRQYGASGGRPDDPQYRDIPEGPYTVFKPGPGNVFIEKQSGWCPWCKREWKTHLRPVWIRKHKDHTCPQAPQPKEVLP